MPYPRRLLNDYETITLDMHPHWWFFAGPVSILTGLLLFTLWVRSKLDGTWETIISYILLAAIVVSLAHVITNAAKWGTTNFVVTSHRIVFRQGVFGRSGIEITLEKVNNVNFHQTVIERIIGAGDLLIESGGEAGQQRFSDIRSPEAVQKIIQSSLQQHQINKSGLATQQTSGDMAAQLEKLADLRDRGILTNIEFEEQKRKLLG